MKKESSSNLQLWMGQRRVWIEHLDRTDHRARVLRSSRLSDTPFPHTIRRIFGAPAIAALRPRLPEDAWSWMPFARVLACRKLT